MYAGLKSVVESDATWYKYIGGSSLESCYSPVDRYVLGTSFGIGIANMAKLKERY